MIHIDVPRVKGKMAEKNLNITSTAKELEIDRNTFSGYLKQPEKMPYEIMTKLADLICDSVIEAKDIFFCQ